MDFGAIIEVAIGIIFVWIVLSLTTIQIQEWVSTRLDRRAKDLEASIHEMLANENLKAQFYDHPVIRGLTAKKRKQPSRTPAWFYNHPLVRGFTKEKRRIPSYIPSRQFALTLFDITLTAGTESSLIQQGILKLRDDIEKDKNISADKAVVVELNLLAELARSAAATEAGTAITQKTLAKLKDEADKFIENYPQYADVMEATLEGAARLKNEIDIVLKNQPKKDLRSPLGKLRRGVAALSVISPEVNQTLNALLMNLEDYAAGTESELAKARGNVEKWFDDSMDRVSGAFKRYSQMMALIIGFIVALVLNVDSIDLTLYLWAEPAVRTALAQNAEAFELSPQEIQTNPEQAMQDFREQFAGLALPVGWGITNFHSPSISNPECQLFPGQNEAFGIPIVATTRCIVPPQSTNDMNILLKLSGIFLTALAARQGAPFWFDILKKAVNLRGTGANPVEKGR